MYRFHLFMHILDPIVHFVLFLKILRRSLNQSDQQIDHRDVVLAAFCSATPTLRTNYFHRRGNLSSGAKDLLPVIWSPIFPTGSEVLATRICQAHLHLALGRRDSHQHLLCAAALHAPLWNLVSLAELSNLNHLVSIFPLSFSPRTWNSGVLWHMLRYLWCQGRSSVSPVL